MTKACLSDIRLTVESGFSTMDWYRPEYSVPI